MLRNKKGQKKLFRCRLLQGCEKESDWCHDSDCNRVQQQQLQLHARIINSDADNF